PGRDDREDGAEPQHAPWDAGLPQNPAPANDDLKVAGAPIADYPADAGATAAMPSAAGAPSQDGFETTRNDFAPPADFEPREDTADTDFEAMRRPPRSSHKLIKIAAVAAAVVVVGGGAAGAWAMTGGSGSGSGNKSNPPQQQVQ